MRESDRVKVFDAIADLAEDAVNFRSAHASRHHYREEIEWRILHHLRPSIIYTMHPGNFSSKCALTS